MRIYHVFRYQRIGVLWEVGPHRRRNAPIIALSRAGIVESCIGIDPSLDVVADVYIDIATHTEPRNVVITGFSELKIVAAAIVINVTVEAGKLSATANLCNCLVTGVHLADIIRRIIIDIRVTIGVKARSMMINVGR